MQKYCDLKTYTESQLAINCLHQFICLDLMFVHFMLMYIKFDFVYMVQDQDKHVSICFTKIVLDYAINLIYYVLISIEL